MGQKIADIIPMYDFDDFLYRFYYTDVMLTCRTIRQVYQHYLKKGREENRKVFSKSRHGLIPLHNNFLYYQPPLFSPEREIREIRVRRFFISLATVPPRFLHPHFENHLLSLCVQTTPVECIFVYLCKEYGQEKYNWDSEEQQKEMNEKIEYYQKKYRRVVFHFSEDYGPITKVLGALTLASQIQPDDVLIIVDDDQEYHRLMTTYYRWGFEMYPEVEGIFCDDKEFLNGPQTDLTQEPKFSIFYNEYKDFVYGWTSFSICYRNISSLHAFYQEIVQKYPKVRLHDDLILTLFYRTRGLKCAGLNLLLAKIIRNEEYQRYSLSQEELEKPFRVELEKQLCQVFGLVYSNRKLEPFPSFPPFLCKERIKERIERIEERKEYPSFLPKVKNVEMERVERTSDVGERGKIEEILNVSTELYYVNAHHAIFTLLFLEKEDINAQNILVSFRVLKSFGLNFKKEKVHLETNCLSSQQSFFLFSREKLEC
jgi:hypothetical protein